MSGVQEATSMEIDALLGDVDAAQLQFGLKLEGRDVAIAITLDPFDSEMLNLRIARVHATDVASADEFCGLYAELSTKSRALAFDQLVRRVPVERLSEIWALERSGFELMDLGITFARRITGRITAKDYPDLVIRPATEDHMQRIIPAMVVHPWGSRYDADPAYQSADIQRLRTQWLWNCYKGRADVVLVGEIDSQPAGYVTCLVDRRSGNGWIELVGTLPSFQRRGVAARILEHALAWFSSRTDYVTVGTQATNYAAAKLYERAGFTLAQSDATYRLDLTHHLQAPS